MSEQLQNKIHSTQCTQLENNNKKKEFKTNFGKIWSIKNASYIQHHG